MNIETICGKTARGIIALTRACSDEGLLRRSIKYEFEHRRRVTVLQTLGRRVRQLSRAKDGYMEQSEIKRGTKVFFHRVAGGPSDGRVYTVGACKPWNGKTIVWLQEKVIPVDIRQISKCDQQK